MQNNPSLTCQTRQPWGEVSPLWHPASSFSSLSDPLQSAGISVQPVVDIPSMLLNLLVEELSNVQNGRGRWIDQEPGSLDCLAPHGHKFLHKLPCGHITSIGKGTHQQPPLHFFFIYLVLALFKPPPHPPHGVGLL